MMRSGSFIELSNRRATLLRWLVVGFCLLVLLFFATRVASAHEHPALGAQIGVVHLDAAPAPYGDDCPHAGRIGCNGALACHAGLAQVEFAVSPSSAKTAFAWPQVRSLDGLVISPLFHPPRRVAQA